MKRRIVAGVVGLCAGASLAIPQMAHAAGPNPPFTGSCSSTPTVVGTAVAGRSVGVFGTVTTSGATVSANTGACVGGVLPGAFSGGAVEGGVTTANNSTRVCTGTAGSGTTVDNPVGVYAIVDGDDGNVDGLPNNPTKGYAGVSNYETGGTGTSPCPGVVDNGFNPESGGSGSNSGGYIGVKPQTVATFPPAIPVIGGTPIPGGPFSTPGVYLPVPFVACGNTSGATYGTNGRDGCATP
jgi:hypothetical protein